jgi:hypothetical protein
VYGIRQIYLYMSGRLQPWRPDCLLTRQIRAKISLILHLTQETTRLSNRLRSVLLRYYPAALQVFKGGLTTPIAAQTLGYAGFERLPALTAIRVLINFPTVLPAKKAVIQRQVQIQFWSTKTKPSG